LILKKVGEGHDVTDAAAAAMALRASRTKGEILTGLFYLNAHKKSLEEQSSLPAMPLAHLSEKELRPSADFLTQTLREFK
jgi:hypothetical protein